MKEKLEIVPITQKEANAFVAIYHRHHKPVVGSIFQVACAKGNEIIGVAIVGRPVSRLIQENGKKSGDWTLEVTRLCTNGDKNVCSKLYAASWRIAKELGWKRLITYILSSETGISLIAAGWKLVGEAGGGTWDRNERPRFDKHPTGKKLLFEAA